MSSDAQRGGPGSAAPEWLKPTVADRNGFGTLYFNPHDLDALKIVAASKLFRTPLHLEEVRDKAAPVLFVRSGTGQTLQDTFSITWLLSTAATGHSRSPAASLWFRSTVLQWHFFCESELNPFVAGLLHGASSQTRDVKFANKHRKDRLVKSLDVLNVTLRQAMASGRKFLVGDKMTLADICVATAILPIVMHHSSSNPVIKDVWGRKDLSYLKNWLHVQVLGSKTFEAAGRSFPELQLQHHYLQGSIDVNSNSVKRAEFGSGGEAKSKGVNNGAKTNRSRNNGGRRPTKASSGSALVKELPPLPSKPFRILCLHGYRQNETSFREKLGAFRGITGKFLDFTFITAPNRVLPLSAEDINQDQRGWWFSRDSDYFQAQDVTDCDKGFEQSLATIVEAFELHGPFHGLMGFSQGAALVALLCLLKARQPDFFSDKVTFQFAIMVAAFRSRSSRHAEFFDQTNPLFKKVQIPTLHVIGDSDRIIDRSMSEEILTFFDCPSVMHHSGAHFVPASSRQKMGYLGFLSKVYETVKPDQGHQEENARQPEGHDETDPKGKEINDNTCAGGDAALVKVGDDGLHHGSLEQQSDGVKVDEATTITTNCEAAPTPVA